MNIEEGFYFEKKYNSLPIIFQRNNLDINLILAEKIFIPNSQTICVDANDSRERYR